ncbi:nucleotide exchange factor GrpE [Paenibacillus luteus]|uniref:nucleotide exchange factor GrpE n=1 Tax=Paenibacillus luteus TaxID=2545753 RepID=UPI0011437C89|nr:nucleotide exchange factor GrpE [Paenibacillus luteus]
MSTKEQHNEAAEAAEEVISTEQSEQGNEETASEVSEEDARYVELVKQAEESQQRLLRTQADFDNFRRRTLKEKEELGQYASMKLIGQLLPVVDNFERAVAAASVNGDFESLAKGVDMIFRQLEQTLEQEGLKAMNVVGEPFNPDFHQAIMQVDSDEHEEGIIVEEVQKGYILKEKVLRPAMVKVSS